MEGQSPQRAAELAKSLTDRVRERADPFDRLLQVSVGSDAHTQRQGRRWQAQIEEESATWEGTLLDFAEAQAHLSLATFRGAQIVGRLVGVGTGVLVIQRSGAPDLWLRTASVASVASVSPRTGRQTTRGSREVTPVSMQDLLFQASATRPSLTLIVAGQANPLNGVLLSCGADVCTVKTDGELRRTVLVHIPAIEEAVVYG